MHRREFLSRLASTAAVLLADGRSATPAGAGRIKAPRRCRVWDLVTVDVAGPEASETGTPNPFTDIRLGVRFCQGEHSQIVWGFFAADGDAANSGATAGRVWRTCFVPDRPGEWTYEVSFRRGPWIALSTDWDQGDPLPGDGLRGSFLVTERDRKDGRSRGLLRYVGKHHLQFAGSGEYFLKGGADSPENFLAYAEFDGTTDLGGAGRAGEAQAERFLHTYQPHLRDWRPGDPVWGGGRGKGIIGALNYLASKGMNSVYMVIYNIDGGDGKDVWPWLNPRERTRFDVSKLEQWEIVFRHMDELGIMLHVVLHETENDRKLGGSAELNRIRRLYLREMVARFAHHLAVIWNLGEENNLSPRVLKAMARYIRSLDPYDHPITVHTHLNRELDRYRPLYGHPCFEATSIQADVRRYHRDAVLIRRESARAGRPWAVFGDEQPPARHGVPPDSVDPNHDRHRKYALWGNLMGGGSGVEWYFGYEYPNNDLTCEDWRSRDRIWDQTRFALDFFRNFLPFQEMDPTDELARAERAAWVLARPDTVYAVYLPEGGRVALELPVGQYSVRWYNPRTGGELQMGSKPVVEGGALADLGLPPQEPALDWAILCRRM